MALIDLTFKIEDDLDHDDDELFYSQSNVVAILEGLKSLKEGRYVEKTMEELRAYEKK